VGRDPLADAKPLIHDLVATGVFGEEEAREFVTERLTHPSWPDNDPWGLFHLAEAVQADLHDSYQHRTWPPCPRHPHHPLWLGSPMDNPLVWRCPSDDSEVAALGSLAPSGDADQ
jgi:hypothetical protein